MVGFYKYPMCENIRIYEYIPYRREVVRYLDLIASTYTGRTLYKYIKKRITPIEIIPFVPDPLNPSTDPQDISRLPDAFDTNAIVPGTAPPAQGTGHGTSMRVRYHPAAFRQLMVNLGRVLPGAGPGEMLYHELVHAMQAIHGKLNQDPVPEDFEMDGFHEFCAVVGANIYRSERGFKVMRSHHRSFDGERSDDVEYYNFFESQFRKWFTLQRDFCTEMAWSRAKFNPLRVAANDLGILPPTPMALPP